MVPALWNREGPCPRRHLHYPDQPKDYGAWDRWADRMAATHTQVRCPGCGLYEIWIPRTVTTTTNVHEDLPPRYDRVNRSASEATQRKDR